MKTLRDAIRIMQDRYALKRDGDTHAVIRSFWLVFDKQFKGKEYKELIIDVKMKKNRMVISVTHPAVIMEMQGIKRELIKAINKNLGEKLLQDLIFKVVPS